MKVNVTDTDTDTDSEYWLKEWLFLCMRSDAHLSRVEGVVNLLLLHNVRQTDTQTETGTETGTGSVGMGMGCGSYGLYGIIPFTSATHLLSKVIIPTLEHIVNLSSNSSGNSVGNSSNSGSKDKYKNKINKIISNIKIYTTNN